MQSTVQVNKLFFCSIYISGIDPRVWRQAQEDNPDTESMIPAPIIGIDALKKRIHIQEVNHLKYEDACNVIMINAECFQEVCQRNWTLSIL